MDLCERTVQGLGQAGQYAGDRQQDTQNDCQHVDAEIAAGIIAAVDVRAADGVDDQEDPAQERQGVENAAKYCGMAEKRNIILSLMISGALAGMGAAMLYLTSYEQWQCSSSSVPAMGFNGIAAAFLGGLNPIGSIFASFFIQHITAGGAYVDKSMYCAQISDLISALIIYLCGFVLFMKNVMSSIAARREEKAIAKAKALAEAKKGGETE